MIDCGSQCILCDLPVRYDTYKGCSHGCKYCFVQRKTNISKIEEDASIASLKRFIMGGRTLKTKWCDWKIPLHIGGMSDPFQPCEKHYRATYRALKILEESQYPFIVSTKGALVADDEYLDILSRCNCVVQISAVCSKYDRMEPGCPNFMERMKMAKKVAPKVKRLIIRVQPYVHEVFDDVYNNIELYKDVGAYGFIVEGIKLSKKQKGFVRVGADWVYPYTLIKSDFIALRERARKVGIHIYAGENRIRTLGDSLTCCGVDGLEGFTPSNYNIQRMIFGGLGEPTPGMKEKRTGDPIRVMDQTTIGGRRWTNMTYADAMKEWYIEHKKQMEEVFGVARK